MQTGTAFPVQELFSPEDIEPFLAAADALRWLEHQTQAGRAKLWKDPPSRYLLGKFLATSFFTITFDAQGEWVVAAFDMPAMKWFTATTWQGIMLRQGQGGKPGMLSLVSKPVTVPPAETIGFPGGTIPVFGVDFALPSRMFKHVVGESFLRLGHFSADKETIRLTKGGRALPVRMTTPQERR